MPTFHIIWKTTIYPLPGMSPMRAYEFDFIATIFQHHGILVIGVASILTTILLAVAIKKAHLQAIFWNS